MTAHSIDFFAPAPSLDLSAFDRLLAKQEVNVSSAFQLDSADRFTYIVMGLAICIAIFIPLLNWN